MKYILIGLVLRNIILGIGVGVAFIKWDLFKGFKNEHRVLAGIGFSPIIIAFSEYAVALIVKNRFCIVCVPILVVIVFLSLNENYKVAWRTIQSILSGSWNALKEFGWLAYVDVIIALCVVAFFALRVYGYHIRAIFATIFHASGQKETVLLSISIVVAGLLFFLVVVHLVKEKAVLKNARLIAFISVIGCVLLYSYVMIDVPCWGTDRAHYELEARYFYEDSDVLEIDNYSGDKEGSTLKDDHGPLWIVYLADAYSWGSLNNRKDLIECINVAVYWTYYCVLVLLFLLPYFITGSYSAGVCTLVLFHLYQHAFLILEGSRDGFGIIGLLLVFMTMGDLINKSENQTMRLKDYCLIPISVLLAMQGHKIIVFQIAGIALIFGTYFLVRRRIDIVIGTETALLLGTFLSLIPNIVYFIKKKELYTTTTYAFHDTPVIEQINELNLEKDGVIRAIQSFTIPLIVMIVIGTVGIVLLIRLYKNDQKKLLYMLVLLGMLLPISGIMDLFGVRVAQGFIVQIRYRLYILVPLAISGGTWLSFEPVKKWQRRVVSIIGITAIAGFLVVQFDKSYRDSRERFENIISASNEYRLLYDEVSDKTNAYIYTANEVLELYLGNNAKLLFSHASESLIQAKTEKEVEQAIRDLSIGAIILPEDGISYHDYSLLPFWKYINENDSVTRIDKSERKDDCNLVLFVVNEASHKKE